jgi:hypothetical protein
MNNSVGGKLFGDRSYRIHQSQKPMINEPAGDERSCPCSALALRRKHRLVGPVRREVLWNFDCYLHVRPKGSAANAGAGKVWAHRGFCPSPYALSRQEPGLVAARTAARRTIGPATRLHRTDAPSGAWDHALRLLRR